MIVMVNLFLLLHEELRNAKVKLMRGLMFLVQSDKKLSMLAVFFLSWELHILKVGSQCVASLCNALRVL